MASVLSARQRGAKEFRKQFDRRMRNMVYLLKSSDAYFFYKRVSKTMATEVVQGPYAYSLEFPCKFLCLHSKKFDEDVTFLVKDSRRTWPIKITIRAYRRGRPRVFAYGDGGWKAFLMDNSIKVGDFLIFRMIKFSHFQVIIGRAPAEVPPRDKSSADKSSAKWFRNPSPWWNADQAPKSCRGCKQAAPCPRFLVPIRPSSHPRHVSLVVPGRFWELHGSMLACDELQLKGPNKAILMVEAKRTYLDDAEEEVSKLSVRLDSGWEAFVVANKLEVGDVLEFFLVGSSCFTVERIQKY